MSEKYIAAVEISSSKIIASVGRTSGVGDLEVIATEQEKGVEGVRYGIIQNLEETSVRLSRILRRLESNPKVAPKKIAGVIVGLSGRSVKSISTEVSYSLPEESEITDEILNRLRNDAMRTPIDSSLEVVDAVPRVYRVGKTETHTPKGTIGNHIQATYDLIVCRPELKRNINRTIPDKLNIKVEGFVVTALAVGHLILSAEEKRLGCMLVDMGAETTTVTIYKNGNLRYFATLPLGGRNITRDITSLSVLEERAEEIKITSGNAIARDASTLNLNGLKLSDVSNLVVARSEEIVANIIEQISYAGLKEQDLPGGIICVGGAARMRGMSELLAQESGLQVRQGELPSYVRIDGKHPADNVDDIEVISVMYVGATMANSECLVTPQHQELPITGSMPESGDEPDEEDIRVKKPKQPSKRNKFLSRMSDSISRIFSNPEDDSSELD